ncbi:MAG: hypothetical protein IKV87_09505 [Methanobrevibacter sp.]|nr:hypothetical protein [Methanobrevibacter sp.]
MYRIINEDNSLVTEYPSNVLYGLLSQEEKEYIQLFKNEMDKLTEKEGIGRITVSLSPEINIIEKAFVIHDTNGYNFYEFEEIVDKIRDHMTEFCESDEKLNEFYNSSHIISA